MWSSYDILSWPMLSNRLVVSATRFPELLIYILPKMDLPTLPDKQFLIERAVKRAQAALSPRDLELLWPSFPISFRSVYGKRDPNKPAPKRDQVLSSSSSEGDDEQEQKQERS